MFCIASKLLQMIETLVRDSNKGIGQTLVYKIYELKLLYRIGALLSDSHSCIGWKHLYKIETQI